MVFSLFQSVSPVKEGPGWQRKEVVVADDQQRITCKLWNTESEIKEGGQYKFSNMVVNEYNQVLSLNSMDESEFTVMDETDAMQDLIIEGFDVDGDVVQLVMSNGGVYKANFELVHHAIGDLDAIDLPLTVTVRVSAAAKIIEMERA